MSETPEEDNQPIKVEITNQKETVKETTIYDSQDDQSYNKKKEKDYSFFQKDISLTFKQRLISSSSWSDIFFWHVLQYKTKFVLFSDIACLCTKII